MASDFEVLWRAWKQARLRNLDARLALDHQFRLAVVSVVTASLRKRKPVEFRKAHDVAPDLCGKVRDHFVTQAGDLLDVQESEERELEAWARRAALGHVPRVVPLADGVVMRQVWSSTYRSTGDGIGYARAQAEQWADHARHWGVEAEVRQVNERSGTGLHGWSWRSCDFDVQVGTDRMGAEALLLKPGPSLVEWVAACWRRGRNPRVYNPFLPHGFEERHGISWHGALRGPFQRALTVFAVRE